MKFTQELESLAPSSSKYQIMLALATALKTINKQRVFLKLMEKRLPLFPSLPSSLRHFSAARSRVFTKRSPTSNHSFYLAVIQYLLNVFQRPKAAFPNILSQTKNYNTALFVSTFFLKPISVAVGVQLRQ